VTKVVLDLALSDASGDINASYAWNLHRTSLGGSFEKPVNGNNHLNLLIFSWRIGTSKEPVGLANDSKHDLTRKCRWYF
jgi:hypothetical protein